MMKNEFATFSKSYVIVIDPTVRYLKDRDQAVCCRNILKVTKIM